VFFEGGCGNSGAKKRGKLLVICGEFCGGLWTEDGVFLSAENFPRFEYLFSVSCG
jgi:hypothetical protein